jgi:hypothetical protein
MSSSGDDVLVGGNVNNPHLYSWASSAWSDAEVSIGGSGDCDVALSGNGLVMAIAYAHTGGDFYFKGLSGGPLHSGSGSLAAGGMACNAATNYDGRVMALGYCSRGSSGEVAGVKRATNQNFAGHYHNDDVTNIFISDPAVTGPFTVAVSAGSTVDDIYVAVGAPTAYGGQGAAFVFRSTNGGSFVQLGNEGTDTVVDIVVQRGIGASDGFGTSVSLVGDANSMTLAVGSPGAEDTSATVVGRVDLFHVSGSNAIITTKYGDAAGDKFGTSVALSEDDDGNTLVVGAPQTGTGSGYVKVYQGSGHPELGNGGPSGTANGDAFGTAVAISGDGSRIAVGAPGKANGEVTAWEYTSGSASSTTTPTSAPTTTPTSAPTTTRTAVTCVDVTLSDGSPWVDEFDKPCDWFRTTVHLPTNQMHCSEDGIMTPVHYAHLAWPNGGHTAGTACCACGGGVSSVNFFETPVGSAIAGNSNKGIGSAVSLSNDGNTVIAGGRGNGGNLKVFTWSGSWQGHSLVKPGDGPSGYSVAISGDGTRFVVTDDASGSGRISTYDLVTTPDSYGKVWTDPDTVDTLTGTGCSAALTTTGIHLAVGACSDNPKVRLYSYEGTQWSTAAELEVTGPGTSLFGHSVAIAETASGVVVAVGAPADADGKVYLFLATDHTSPKEVSTPTDILVNEKFGYSVSLSADGSVLAVGSPDFGAQSPRGAVRIFDVVYGATGDDTATTHVRTLFGNEGDEFGTSVSLSPDGQALFVGAPGANDDEGYVAVYDGSDDWIRIKTVYGEPDSRFGTSVSAAEFDGTIRFAAGAPGVANMPGQIRMYDIGSVEPTSDDSGTSAANLGAIIGGSVGGVALIAAAVYFLRGKAGGEGDADSPLLSNNDGLQETASV